MAHFDAAAAAAHQRGNRIAAVIVFFALVVVSTVVVDRAPRRPEPQPARVWREPPLPHRSRVSHAGSPSIVRRSWPLPSPSSSS